MIVNGLLNVSITSIEKRFDIESADAGLIASCYDIAAVICLIPVGYFGGHGSKPRWLGFGALIMGVGAFVFALPHFTTGLYEYVTLTHTMRSQKVFAYECIISLLIFQRYQCADCFLRP